MTRLGVFALFSGHYLLMAFLVCLGAIQLAAARSGRRHLWLVGRRYLTYLLGALLVAGGISIFYLLPLFTNGPWGPPSPGYDSPTWAHATWQTLPSARNINDTVGGLSGHWQALWFSVGFMLAAVSARTGAKWRGRRVAEPELEARRHELVGSGSRTRDRR